MRGEAEGERRDVYEEAPSVLSPSLLGHTSGVCSLSQELCFVKAGSEKNPKGGFPNDGNQTPQALFRGDAW